MKEALRSEKVRLGCFEIDLLSGELRKQGMKVKLHNQPFQVLALLLERPGEMVTREQLRRRLWPADTFVDFEVGLNQAVKKLRDALGDSAENPRYIETLPRRGYRLIAPVEQISAEDSSDARPVRPQQSHRALWIVMITMAVAIGYLGYFWKDRLVGTRAGTRVMLVVLPFTNLTGDPGQEYFSDGFTEEMIGLLSQYPPEQLAVIARTSAMRYKGVRKSAADIGQELGVDYLLEGSVRREAGHVRINAQLIRVKDQSPVWAKTYDRELRQVLPLQNEVAGDIAREIKVTLSPGRPMKARAPRDVNPQAYDVYLRGLYRWQLRGKEDLEKAIEYFEEAARLDPSFALSYASLARAHAAYYGRGFIATALGVERSVKAAEKALALNPFLGEAEVVLAWAHVVRWEWAEAEKKFLRALKLNPNDPIAHLWYGNFLLRMGRMQENLLHRQRAYELDPLDGVVSNALARALFEVGREAEAFLQLQKTADLHGKNSGFYAARSTFYLRKKDFAAARRDLEEGVRLCNRCPDLLAKLGHVLAVAGDKKQATKILNNLKTISPYKLVSPHEFAILYAGLGEPDRAFDWLEQEFSAHEFSLISLREDPFLAPLRLDSRFQDLLRRMNFPNLPSK